MVPTRRAGARGRFVGIGAELDRWLAMAQASSDDDEHLDAHGVFG